jgi:hypothetical protein
MTHYFLEIERSYNNDKALIFCLTQPELLFYYIMQRLTCHHVTRSVIVPVCYAPLLHLVEVPSSEVL